MRAVEFLRLLDTEMRLRFVSFWMQAWFSNLQCSSNGCPVGNG